MSIGQGWISLELVSFSGLLLMLHGGVFVLSMAWLVKRHLNWSFRSFLSKRAPHLSAEAKVQP
jgi:lipopolysaccharide export system permease protein